MAKLIPDDQWQELKALADALLARSREISEREGIVQSGFAGPDLQAVVLECQGLNLATLALAAACPLSAAEMFIGMGGAMGVVLAQQTDNHPSLLHAFRAQMKDSYNEVVVAAAPMGTA